MSKSKSPSGPVVGAVPPPTPARPFDGEQASIAAVAEVPPTVLRPYTVKLRSLICAANVRIDAASPEEAKKRFLADWIESGLTIEG